jgi:hypothetical protein
MATEPVLVERDEHHDVYTHPLVSWGAVIAGALAALAVGFTLTLLGVAAGATLMSPYDLAVEQGPGATVGAGIVIAFSNLVAMQCGGFVAARAATWPDHHHGMLQGLAVWGLVFLVALVALGGGVGAMLPDVTPSGAVEGLSDLGEQMSGAPGDVGRAMSESEQENLKAATMATAWWAFATMVLGAVGAVAGGYLGGKHPIHWGKRERRRPITTADPAPLAPSSAPRV